MTVIRIATLICWFLGVQAADRYPAVGLFDFQTASAEQREAVFDSAKAKGLPVVVLVAKYDEACICSGYTDAYAAALGGMSGRALPVQIDGDAFEMTIRGNVQRGTQPQPVFRHTFTEINEMMDTVEGMGVSISVMPFVLIADSRGRPICVLNQGGQDLPKLKDSVKAAGSITAWLRDLDDIEEKALAYCEKGKYAKAIDKVADIETAITKHGSKIDTMVTKLLGVPESHRPEAVFATYDAEAWSAGVRQAIAEDLEQALQDLDGKDAASAKRTLAALAELDPGWLPPEVDLPAVMDGAGMTR